MFLGLFYPLCAAIVTPATPEGLPSSYPAHTALRITTTRATIQQEARWRVLHCPLPCPNRCLTRYLSLPPAASLAKGPSQWVPGLGFKPELAQNLELLNLEPLQEKTEATKDTWQMPSRSNCALKIGLHHFSWRQLDHSAGELAGNVTRTRLR